MVGVIKSKGPQEQTRAAGVLQINTAADQVASALGRAADRVGQVAYQQFEDEQTEIGRQAAKNMKMRDDKGNIIYQDITENMTRVARNAARPIIEENYARQLKIDFNNSLMELRDDKAAHNDDPVKFAELAQIKLEGIMAGIPADFAGVGTTVLETIGAERTQEHVNQLTQAKIRQEQDKAIYNMAIDINDDVSDIGALIRSGDVQAAQKLAVTAIGKAKQIIDMGGTLQMEKALIRDIETTLYGEAANQTAALLISEGLYDVIDDLSNAFELGQIVQGDKQISVGGQVTTVNEFFKSIGVTDEAINGIDDIEVRGAIAAQMRTVANQFSQERTKEAKTAAINSEYNNHMMGNGLGNTGKEVREDMQLMFDQKGLTSDKITSPEAAALAQDPNSELGQFLRRGQVFPQGIQIQLVNTATSLTQKTPDELRSLLTFWAVGSLGTTSAGTVTRDKLDHPVANAFWANVNAYANTYGMEAATQYAVTLASGNANTSDLENQARTRLGDLNKDAMSQIKDRWMEDGWIQDANPKAIDRLSLIARRAYAALPPDDADEYMKNAYDALFAPTDYIIMPNVMGASRVDRSEFAPERFYTSEMMPTFISHVDSKLATTGRGLKFGKDAFLHPTPDSSNSSVTWQVLDKFGEPVTNSNGPILVRSQELNRTQTMAAKFAEAMAKKEEKARSLRDGLIRSQGGLPRDAGEFAFGDG